LNYSQPFLLIQVSITLVAVAFIVAQVVVLTAGYAFRDVPPFSGVFGIEKKKINNPGTYRNYRLSFDIEM
jgi:hypothetical protein